MAYSINPNLPKARALALKMLLLERVPLTVVARKYGVHRTTIWRWKKKWLELNKYVEEGVFANRPGRAKYKKVHLNEAYYRWSIKTISSAPHYHPWTIPESVVKLALEIRRTLRRCAEVVWHHLTTELKIKISLSSVRRILRRNHCFDGARKPRLRYNNPKRPLPTKPGELVQIDTIHHVDHASGRRLYYYTVIDLYTRLSYVTFSTKLRPGLAAQAVLEAQAKWGFKIQMVQADNGPEFGRYFEQTLKAQGIAVRHSRLGRPNDNAHIERFNRTLQTECIGYYWRASVSLQRQEVKLRAYLEYYNNKRVHLGIQLQTPSEMLQRL